MGSVKWGDIPCVQVQAVRESCGRPRSLRVSRKGSRREIKLDCHVFPMPVNNLASWKCNRPFPEQNVVTGEGGRERRRGGGMLSFWLITNCIDLSFWLDSIFFIPFFFLLYNIFLFFFSFFFFFQILLLLTPFNLFLWLRTFILFLISFFYLYLRFFSSDFPSLWIIYMDSCFNYSIFLAFLLC